MNAPHGLPLDSSRTAGLLTACLVASGLLFTPALNAAVFHAYTNVYDGSNQVTEAQVRCLPVDDECPNSPFGAGTLGSEASLSTTQGAMQGFAQASNRGVLRASGIGSWGDSPYFAIYPAASGQAEIHDQFMLVDPSGTHSEAQISLSVLLSGSLSENRGGAEFTANVSLVELMPATTGPAALILLRRQGQINNGVYSGDPASGLMSSGLHTFRFNTLLNLQFSLIAGCGARDAFGSCAAHMDQSAHWGGITVLDDTGQPIPGVQLVSASGMNWLEPSPVPAPGAFLLMATGLWALLARTRKRPS